MNQCHFLGNLTRDPELVNFAGDKKVVKFGLAVNRRYKKDGQQAKETSFLDCEAWATGAELIAKHFQKGSPIIVHGSIKQDNWTDKNTGDKRSKLILRVNEFEFVPGSKAKPADEKAPVEKVADDTNDGDVPF
jgi:single-strand DNA-binding protein